MNGKNKILSARSERKSIDWMQDLVAKFSKPGKLVEDPFPGRFPTAKTIPELLRHHRLVGCKDYFERSVTSMQALVETYTR